MLNLKHTRELIVRPVLKHIWAWSEAAEELVMTTGMKESRFTHLTQIPRGPARGLWQMEEPTFRSIWNEFLEERSRVDLKKRIESLAMPGIDVFQQLTGNNYLAAAMCRVHYLRFREPLPKTLTGMAEYWKKYYNTYLGKGKVGDFIDQGKRMYAIEDIPFSPGKDWRRDPIV